VKKAELSWMIPRKLAINPKLLNDGVIKDNHTTHFLTLA